MEAGGIDWPSGVTTAKRFIHPVPDILLSVCPPSAQPCASNAGEGAGLVVMGFQRVRIICMLPMQTARPLLVSVGSRAQGSVFLTITLGNTFHQENLGNTV